MLAACPRCRARYRLDPARIEGRKARVRCRRCDTLFPVSPRARPVRGALIASADGPRAKQISQCLALAEGEVLRTHDGCEAVLAAVRQAPAVVIVDEELDGLGGFEVCEILKRTQGQEAPRVILVTPAPSTHASPRNSTAPDAVVAADALEQELVPVLVTLGFAVSQVPLETHRTSTQPEPAQEKDPLAEQREGAARLARIVVADIVLYDPGRFDEAARADRLKQVLATELREGRALFERRIDARVRSERDYLAEELDRVAKQRCGQGVERA